MCLESQRLAQQTMAFVLAGGRGSRLYELTDSRVKPAVYFSGKCRIIDFTLSNAVNSGIRRTCVATQYKAHSLIRHLQRGWSFFRAERNESLDILPASYCADSDGWYKGTADAVTQNIEIIKSYNPKYLLILAGDHIYKQDYSLMIKQHVDTEADVTVGCVEVPREQADGLGIMSVNSKHQILAFTEKPDAPATIPNNPEQSLASMGIYVFKTDFLIDLLEKDAINPNSSHDFGKDLIPTLVNSGKAVAHPFSRSCVRNGLEVEPYWRDVGTLDAFWQANIDLTDFIPKLDIYDNQWPIWTYSELTSPAKFIHNEDGRRGNAVSSMVSGGCIISGSHLEQCLLFTGVHTHSYSNLKGVVAMPHVEVGRHANITNAIIDRGVIIPEGLVVGADPELDAKRFRRSEQGVCLITQSMINDLQSENKKSVFVQPKPPSVKRENSDLALA